MNDEARYNPLKIENNLKADFLKYKFREIDMKTLVEDETVCYATKEYQMQRQDDDNSRPSQGFDNFGNFYYKKVCDKLATYHSCKGVLPSIEDLCIPQSAYDGKNGLVKLAYTACYDFSNAEEDIYENEFYENENQIDEQESSEKNFYTNISFTIDTYAKQIIFWFPLFS